MSISKEQMTAMLSGRDRFKCSLTDLVPIGNTTPTSAQDGADTRKGVGVLLVHNGKLLCATRRKEGTICGPGGHIEEMELPEDAAVRETQEEFGITPLDLIPLAELTSMPEEYCDSQIYLSTDYDGTIKCDEEEMTRPGFIAVDTVQQLAEQSPERLFLPFALSVEKFVQLILTPDAQKATMKEAEISADGGAGSGNFGHKGVPGQLGGSAPGDKQFTKSAYEKAIVGAKTSDGRTVRKVHPHAVKRGHERKIYPSTIAKALQNGTKTSGNIEGRSVYDYRGTRVVVVDSSMEVRTVIYRGKKGR